MPRSKAKPGLVYVLLNAAMPGLVKVGFTTATAEQRAKQLKTTGVPSDFVVVWDEGVEDAPAVERAVHDALSPWRPKADREFFTVPPKQAIRVLMECASGQRLRVSTARSRNFLPELRGISSTEVPPGIVDMWLEYERGAISIAGSTSRSVVMKCRLGQTFATGEPAFSPLDPPDTSVDLLLALPVDVVDAIVRQIF